MRSKKYYCEKIEKITHEHQITAKRADLELYCPDKMNTLKAEILHDAYMWLKDRALASLNDYAKIRRLCSEDVWEFYESMGDCEDLAEVQLLKRARINLKKVITNKFRPVLFKKRKINEVLRKNEKRHKASAGNYKAHGNTSATSKSDS